MALNVFLENMIMSRKREQAKSHECGQLYAEIMNLSIYRPRLSLKLDSEENMKTDISPVKKEVIDLLENVLEKAQQVCSGSKPSVTRPNIVKTLGTRKDQGTTTNVMSTNKGQQKSKTIERKYHRNYQTSFHHTGTRQADGSESVTTNDPKNTHRIVTPNKLSAFPDHGQRTISCGSTKQSKQLCGSNYSSTTDSFTTSSVLFSKTTESERNCQFQQEDFMKWSKLKLKENRLWDKIGGIETKSSMLGRELFIARMNGTFPKRWPSGSPEKIRVMMHRLIRQGQDLPGSRQTVDLMARQTPGATTNTGEGEDCLDSASKFERLKITHKDVHKCAVQLKREWESWDRWRPARGCLCPIGIENEWLEGRPQPLPKTVIYSTQRELTELETLRMRVALLQQEVFVEKILSDLLTPHLSSASCSTLNPSILRDLYSVLGEGGERFPAIVLDSDS